LFEVVVMKINSVEIAGFKISRKRLFGIGLVLLWLLSALTVDAHSVRSFVLEDDIISSYDSVDSGSSDESPKATTLDPAQQQYLLPPQGGELARPSKASSGQEDSKTPSQSEPLPSQELDEGEAPERYRSENSCKMVPDRPVVRGRRGRRSSAYGSRRGMVLSDRSPESAFECVESWTEKAEEAFAGKCNGKVTSELMMCIFLREQRGDLTLNACGASGCGMSQMTGSGVRGVKNGLLGRRYHLLDAYKKFFRAIGRPDLVQENPRALHRTDALDMQQAVGMTATLLCAIQIDGARDAAKMAERYNGNYRAPKIVNSYRKFAVQCMNDYKDGSLSSFTRRGVLVSERSSRLRHTHGRHSGRKFHRSAHRKHKKR